MADESKIIMEAIIAAVSEGLIIADRLGNVTTVNKAAADMMGLDQEAGLKYAKEFMTGQLKLSGEGLLSTEKYVTLTGAVKAVIRVDSVPVYWVNKELLSAVTVLTDISKDREAQQMKSDFVSVVSHELRTPLASIREAIAVIKDGVVGPVTDKQSHCLNIALNDADRLTRIINDLLNLTRIESGKTKTARSACDVSQLVGRVITSLSPQSTKAGVNVMADLAEGLPAIFADSDQMIQVLTNLVGNALKFTPPGGKITIGARRFHAQEFVVHSKEKDYKLHTANPKLANFVEISVTDTGPGISDDDKEKLFQKFSQLDTDLTRKAGGTGLGLAITKEIVTKHGGSIWLESEPGKGSTFFFTIPIFSEDSAYLDQLRKELLRAKKAMRNLSLIFIDPDFGESPSEENRKFLGALEGNAKEALHRKEDSVLTYRKGFLIIIAEMNSQAAEKYMGALKSGSGIKFTYKTAVYPQDGVSAEDLWSRVVG